ncbi:MAG: cobalamin-dependent protein [Patescibacteria group bacterium]
MIDEVLLIRPYACEKKEFPLGLLYLGTALKNKGYKVKIVDLHDRPELEGQVLDDLRNSPSTLLGISALAPHYRWVKKFSLEVKKISPGTKIIIGGHIAVSCELLLKNCEADFVCLGEGETALPALIENLNNSNQPETPGIAYLDPEGKVIKNRACAQAKDFLIPDYDLIDINRYLIHPNQDAFFRRSKEYQAVSRPDDKLGVIMFSRGCVGFCGFCYRHLPGFRQGSLNWAWEHLMLLYNKYGIHYFRIDDELFTSDPEWFGALREKIKESGLGIMFRITGLRTDLVNDNLLHSLKDMGCIAVNYGIESFSQKILDRMLKGVTVKDNFRAVELTKNNHLDLMIYLIWGYAGENKDTIKETINNLLSLRLPPESISLFYLVALPGTKIYYDALRSGKIRDEEKYLESLYVIMEKREGIHKYYMLNFSELSELDLIRYEKELFFFLKLQKILGRNFIFDTIKFFTGLLSSKLFLFLLNGLSTVKNSVIRFKKRYKLYLPLLREFSAKIRIQPNIKKLERIKSLPAAGDRYHIVQTINWLKKAHDAAWPGVSRGFSLTWNRKFKKAGWQPPYPETTGYIIPTFINAAKTLNDQTLIDRARVMADWELKIMLPSGAVRGGHLSPKNIQPAVFDTGQVIRGLLAIYEESGEEKYLSAAKKSADWLLAGEDNKTGRWVENNAACVNKKTTTYNIYALAPIARLGKAVGRKEYISCAKRSAEYAISMQNEKGWFMGADFEDRPDLLLHTLAYTIDGLWDAGISCHNERFLLSAKKGLDGILSAMRDDGFIPGRLKADWSSDVSWACLTGIAQAGITALKIYDQAGEEKYLTFAMKAKDYLKKRQNVSFENLGGGLGAIFGSWPIAGAYQPYQALNWAAKYFADLLLFTLPKKGI